MASFVPPSLREDPDVERRARFTVGIIGVLIVAMIVRLTSLAVSGLRAELAHPAAALVITGAALWVLARTASLVLAGNLLVCAMFLSGVNMAVFRGGIGAPVLIGLGALPLIALFVAGQKAGVAWLAVLVATVFGLAIYEHALGYPLADRIGARTRVPIETVGAALFPIVLFCLGLVYEWTKNAALAAKAEAERARLRTEEAVRMLRADRMASVGQLAAGIAHEVNNPLGYIAGNLDFIARALRASDSAEGPSRAELSEAVSEARQGIERVASIVRDLKTFARDDDGGTRVVDLRVAMQSTIRIAENEIRHRAQLICDFPDEPVLVVANETRLVQVFLNLLVNASHSIAPGHSMDHRIQVTVERSADGCARAVVLDTGEGMTPEVLARATEPFYTTKPIGVGTGLGLSVCKNVVEALGGRLSFESHPGKGTAVTVLLPLTERAPEPIIPESLSVAPVLAPREVLVIDDDPLVARALRRLLRNHHVTTAESGRRALSLLSSGQRFDVILCDLMMPDLTGADVYEQVASLGEGIEQRFVFLTGGVFTDRIRHFLETVPNRRFEKPIRADHLDRILTGTPQA